MIDKATALLAMAALRAACRCNEPEVNPPTDWQTKARIPHHCDCPMYAVELPKRRRRAGRVCRCAQGARSADGDAAAMIAEVIPTEHDAAMYLDPRLTNLNDVLERCVSFRPEYVPVDCLPRRWHWAVTYAIATVPRAFVKIGTTRCLRRRFATLSTASPVNLEIIGLIAGDDEKDIHEQLVDFFDARRVRGEWFADEQIDTSTSLRDVLANYGLCWRPGYESHPYPWKENAWRACP